MNISRQPPFALHGQVADLSTETIRPATVVVDRDGRIERIIPGGEASATPEAERVDGVILPGFVDAHVHVESSMLPPAEFARLAVTHGTVATVSDPHEIANVLGIEGVRYMVREGRKTPMEIAWGAPSCVPATRFETAGAVLEAEDLEPLFADGSVRYLSEVMNYPGVLAGDPGLMAKVALAQRYGVPIDGHAPGLRGEEARRYAAAGIQTDHECVTLDEALDKISAGMKILIREGSAAKNYAALSELLASHPDSCMLCCDDVHPDMLVEGHIDTIVRRAIGDGLPLWNVLRAASVNPMEHYGLAAGRLRVGDRADFIVADDLNALRVRRTYLGGVLVALDGECLLAPTPAEPLSGFATDLESPHIRSFSLCPPPGFPEGKVFLRVIAVRDGQLVTGSEVKEGYWRGDRLDPHLSGQPLVVVNRYRNAPPALGIVRNFNMNMGAIASSVAHDSHNIVAVGGSDYASLYAAIKAVIDARGGLAFAEPLGMDVDVLPLDIAGLMSTADGKSVALKYRALQAKVHEHGCSLTAPFMTLSFLSLLVIPELKLSDRGLFDVGRFEFVDTIIGSAPTPDP